MFGRCQRRCVCCPRFISNGLCFETILSLLIHLCSVEYIQDDAVCNIFLTYLIYSLYIYVHKYTRTCVGNLLETQVLSQFIQVCLWIDVYILYIQEPTEYSQRHIKYSISQLCKYTYLHIQACRHYFSTYILVLANGTLCKRMKCC